MQLFIYTRIQPKSFPCFLESVEKVPLLMVEGQSEEISSWLRYAFSLLYIWVIAFQVKAF